MSLLLNLAVDFHSFVSSLGVCFCTLALHTFLVAFVGNLLANVSSLLRFSAEFCSHGIDTPPVLLHPFGRVALYVPLRIAFCLLHWGHYFLLDVFFPVAPSLF